MERAFSLPLQLFIVVHISFRTSSNSHPGAVHDTVITELVMHSVNTNTVDVRLRFQFFYLSLHGRNIVFRDILLTVTGTDVGLTHGTQGFLIKFGGHHVFNV